jgi:transcriptional regulator with XRE-family HTH domain
LGEYLRARRSGTDPVAAGVIGFGRRRVDGLRRTEVAELAGISQEYYIRLEQGRDLSPSGQVLRALARALQLDPTAVEYMERLVRIQSDAPSEMAAETLATDASGLRALMAQWGNTPALALDRNHNITAVNGIAAALFPALLDPARNLAATIFEDTWRHIDLDWEQTAQAVTSYLRFGADPTDRELIRLVGALSIRDDDFRRLWASHEVSAPNVSRLRLSYAPFGVLEFTLQFLGVPATPRHSLLVLHAEADSLAAHAVDRLGSLAAAQERRRSTHP